MRRGHGNRHAERCGRRDTNAYREQALDILQAAVQHGINVQRINSEPRLEILQDEIRF